MFRDALIGLGVGMLGGMILLKCCPKADQLADEVKSKIANGSKDQNKSQNNNCGCGFECGDDCGCHGQESNHNGNDSDYDEWGR